MTRESDHASETFLNERDELDSRSDRTTLEGVEAETSGHLVRLVDFFFALVLVQGILQYEEVFQTPWDDNAAVILALITVYYTVIRSFIGWHIAQEARRYRIISVDTKTTELWRVYVDIAIVALYAYLLFSAEALKERGDADVGAFLAGFIVLFVLYAIWGHLRHVAWGTDGYSLMPLYAFVGLYGLLWHLYEHGPDPWSAKTMNLVALALAFLLMVGFRYVNWWQYGALDSSEGTGRRWVPRVPNLKVTARKPADESAES